MAIVLMVLSVLMIIGGISCIAAPVATFSALGWLAGISILTVGLSSIFQYAAGHEGRSIWELLGGICGVLFGGFLIFNIFAQAATNLILSYAAAFWLCIHGFCGIIEALNIKKQNQELPDKDRSATWLAVLVLAVLKVLLGIACIIQPILGMISVGLLMGISILTSGAQTFVVALHSLREE